MSALPGADLIEQGLADLRAGRETVAGLLVAVGAARLRRAGVAVPAGEPERPELRLYRLLASQGPKDAHRRFNALIRRLVSYEQAIELMRARSRRMQSASRGAR